MDEPLRLAMVGCGDVSNLHGMAARAIRDKVRFVACCDVDEAAAHAWAGTHGADAAYTDFLQMLEHEPLDAVLLATWPTLHREQIEHALDAGIRAILCEKPLATTGQEALAICEAVERAGAVLLEGFMYRHHPAIRALEERIAAGAVGRVDHVRAAFSLYDPETAAPDDPGRNWRQHRDRGGGAPYDLCSYCVNACGHFSRGLPVRAMALGHTGKYGTIDRMYGLVEYDNGCTGIIESSKQADFSEELAIAGSHGRLRLPIAWTIVGEPTVERSSTDGAFFPTLRHETLPSADAHARQLEHFADVARGNAEPLIPLAESVVNTLTLDALVTSLTEQHPVAIAVPPPITDAFRASRERAESGPGQRQ